MKSILTSPRVTNFVFYISCFLIIYMPLHVFIAQSASLVTGGLEVWKAAKDVFVFLLAPALLLISYKRGLFSDKTFRLLVLLGALYGLLHGLYLLFSMTDDTYSTVVASVYNTRLFLYLLLGYVVGSSARGKEYLRYLATATVIIASVVAILGIAQYFLPHDLLTHVGYSIERGVKPMFFIDDKPDLPRIMSTIKDPNSLGAYLILPIILAGSAVFLKGANKELFARPFRRGTLLAMLGSMMCALLLTFSRGALLALILSSVALLSIVTGKRVFLFLKKYWVFLLVIFILILSLVGISWNTYVFQNVIFHADQSTVLEDPNELRVSLVKNVVDDIARTPEGHGPGTAGLVSINNPKGGVLTENYYLQIAYEVGWLGLVIFFTILSILGYQLYKNRNNMFAAILLSSLTGYIFYSLLIHLWSNEAIALQWWLLTGVSVGALLSSRKIKMRLD